MQAKMKLEIVKDDGERTFIMVSSTSINKEKLSYKEEPAYMERFISLKDKRVVNVYLDGQQIY